MAKIGLRGTNRHPIFRAKPVPGRDHSVNMDLPVIELRMAFAASSTFDIPTKLKPFDWPESLSVITAALSA